MIHIDPSYQQALELLEMTLLPRCIFQIDLIDSSGLTTALVAGVLSEKILSMKAGDILNTTSVKMLSNKLFCIQLRKSSWVSANGTHTGLTVLSYTEKEQLLSSTIEDRNAKNVRLPGTSEAGMEATVDERHASVTTQITACASIFGVGSTSRRCEETEKSSTPLNASNKGMTLALEDFLIRARVLKLYRHALRISRKEPSHARADLRQIIRQEMENNRNCNDKQRIQFLISDGLERVKCLDETLDMQGR
ncbi:hypothetical protein P3S68_000950 [Capsicum galapagoense]